jgi:hypothetical protein
LTLSHSGEWLSTPSPFTRMHAREKSARDYAIMNIAKFLSSLLPSFGRERVLEDLGCTLRELESKVIPEYHQLVVDMRGFQYQNKDVKFLQATFKSQFGGSGDMFKTISWELAAVLANVQKIEALVKENFAKDVAGVGLTYRNANLLQLAEYAAFVSKYARKLAVFVVTAESMQLAGKIDKLNEAIPPAQEKWTLGNMPYFCTALTALSMPTAQLVEKLMDLPEATVSTESEQGLSAQMGADKMDPFKTRLVPLWMNPIYHVGMFVAEWQAARFKEAEEEMQLLQLRRLNLQRLKQGKEDALLDQQIEKVESRIQTVSYKLAQMEKSYA